MWNIYLSPVTLIGGSKRYITGLKSVFPNFCEFLPHAVKKIILHEVLFNSCKPP